MDQGYFSLLHSVRAALHILQIMFGLPELVTMLAWVGYVESRQHARTMQKTTMAMLRISSYTPESASA